MWKFLLDPVVQAVAFLAATSALGLIFWDLYEDARDPSPSRASIRRPRPRAKPRVTAAQRRAPRETAFVEPSVEIWTDNQGETRGRVRRAPAAACGSRT